MGARSGNLDIRRAVRRGRIALLAVLALGLSGCLVSEGPLVAPGEAAFPLPDRASAERLSPNSDNTGWQHQANDSAYRSGSAYIVKRENSDDEMELTLKRIAENTFIAQTKGGEGGYLYGLLVFQGNTIYEYDVDCDDFDEGEARRYGLVKKDEDCTVTSAQGLAAGYLAQLQKGRKPDTAYVLR
ncbi:MAG TPA: hypothetical protein VKU84_18390 [Stellaceae bacterium]|nr:hypothetical protein [Stellaceae bacterium]